MARFIFTILLLVTTLSMANAQTGVVSGKVVDGKTGETLIGSTVMVDDQVEFAASTDVDGNFTIAKVPAGKHKVKVSYIGYQEKLNDVDVKPNDVTKLYLSLMEDGVNLNAVVVTSSIARHDNESAIVVMQKNSTVIQSGISSEEMKRSPDKSSGDVIKRVSGSTIQDGKFAIIRGLADRYNMAMVNNVQLPSTEPDRKAFAFDMFPSNILDNIIIMKTGQPNLPSEWAGGIIQLNTRDIPEKNFLNVSYGIGFTEGTTFNKFKTYQGSNTDFLGFDNGARTLPNGFPGIIELNNLKINNKRDVLNSLGRTLVNTSWKVKDAGIARPNQTLQMSGGFAVRKEKVQLGGVFALSYSNALRHTEGTRSQYEGSGSDLTSDYADDRYNTTVTAAALANIGVVIANNHKIAWKNIYTVNSDNGIIQRDGVSYGNATESNRTSLEFTSAKVFSSNLSAEHVFKPSDIRLRYNGGIVFVNRDQPKTIRYSYERLFTNSNDPLGPNENTDPFLYQFSYGGSDPRQSATFYSALKERVYNAGIDAMVPFKIGKDKQALTVGYTYQNRTRNFEARNMFIDFRGSFNDPLKQESNIDNIINQANFDNGKLTMTPFAFPADMYSANSSTHAAFVMMENNLHDKFKAVWGFRFESFHQELTSPQKIGFDVIPNGNEAPIIQSKIEDTTYVKQYFSGAYQTDSIGRTKTIFPLLPSVNLIYKLNENMNLRASYSESMSRPEFRECAPFAYYDFLRDATLIGNPDLKQTFIHNVDLRYEWFLGKGQSINASIFYKNFTNTVEQTSLATGSGQTFIFSNAKTAYLVGIELEARKNFAFVSPKLEDLSVMANLAYIYSRVDLRNIQNNSSDEQVRPMQGQSPYIINLGLSYLYRKSGTGFTLLYNQIGHRLYASGQVGNPGWYENSRPLLDFQVSQKFWKDKGLIRLTISDIIAASTIYYQNAPGFNRGYQAGKDQVALSQKNFRTYTLQVSFTF